MATGEVGGVRLGGQHDDVGAHGAGGRGQPVRRDGVHGRERRGAHTRATAAPATAWARRSGCTTAQCGVNRPRRASAALHRGSTRRPSASGGRRRRSRTPGPRPARRQTGLLGGGAGQRHRAALATASSGRGRHAGRPRRRWRASPAAWRSRPPARGGRRAGGAGGQQRRAPAAVAAAGPEADVLALEDGDAQGRVGGRGSRPSRGRCSRRRRWPRRRRASPPRAARGPRCAAGIVASHSELALARHRPPARSWQPRTASRYARGPRVTWRIGLPPDGDAVAHDRRARRSGDATPAAAARRRRAPAGWYGDPSGYPSVRYFDGRRWTEHTARRAAPRRRPHPTFPLPVAVGAVVVLMASLIVSRFLLEHLVRFDWPIVVFAAILVGRRLRAVGVVVLVRQRTVGHGHRLDDLGLRCAGATSAGDRWCGWRRSSSRSSSS